MKETALSAARSSSLTTSQQTGYAVLAATQIQKKERQKFLNAMLATVKKGTPCLT